LGATQSAFLNATFTYGALPATFTAGATRSNNPIQVCFVRYSA
jgi:hypothetical protein